MANKHAGDCWIYAANGICTCGMLHRLSRISTGPDYEAHKEEIAKHEYNLYWLNNQEVPPVEPVSQEEMIKIMKEAGWRVPE